MSWEQLIQACQALGVPLVILGVFAWGVWRVIAWIGRELVLPLRDRMLRDMGELFSKLLATLDKVDQNVTQMTMTLKDQSELICEIREDTRQWRVDSSKLPVASSQREPTT